jgi:hypothetical protein
MDARLRRSANGKEEIELTPGEEGCQGKDPERETAIETRCITFVCESPILEAEF